MSELTIQRRLSVSNRRKLSELGYSVDDVIKLEQNPEKLIQIIEKDIKAPEKKTPVQKRSEKLESIERQSFAKLEGVAKRLGITTDQLINAEYTSPLYNPNKSEPMWSRKDRTINPLSSAFWTSTGKKLKGLKIDGIPLNIGLNDARIVSNYRQNLRRLNQFNETNNIEPSSESNENQTIKHDTNLFEDKYLGGKKLSKLQIKQNPITIAGEGLTNDQTPSDRLKHPLTIA